MDELARITPEFGGVSHQRLDSEGPIQWPCRSPEDAGTRTLHLDAFATADGKARLAARPYLPLGEQPDGNYPFVLVTGRRLFHYNSGSMTRRTDNLTLAPGERLEFNPADAARLCGADGQVVHIASRHGTIEAPVEITERIYPGQVFLAFHFPETLANALTSDVVDDIAACPEYKVTAVGISANSNSASKTSR
jgi:formate dehydrogenase major subunit